MLDTSARYVYEVYRLKSVSKAADGLYISQPALSAAIKRAENELGAPIFNRKTLPFTLTPAGKVYIEAVEQMLRIEKQTAERVREIKKGTLRIGTAKHLSYFVVPTILKQFHQQYPQVDVHIEMAVTGRLYELLEKEIVDLLLIPADTLPDNVTVVPLFEERLVVALRRDMTPDYLLTRYGLSHTELLERRYGDDKLIKDMSLLSGLEFVYAPPNTGIYKKHRLLLHDLEMQPYVVSNTGNMLLSYNLMLAGVGAYLTTDVSIATVPPNDNCVFFVLGGGGSRQDFSMVYPTAAVSTMRDAFVDTALQHFAPGYSLTDLRTV